MPQLATTLATREVLEERVTLRDQGARAKGWVVSCLRCPSERCPGLHSHWQLGNAAALTLCACPCLWQVLTCQGMVPAAPALTSPGPPTHLTVMLDGRVVGSVSTPQAVVLVGRCGSVSAEHDTHNSLNESMCIGLLSSCNFPCA